MSYCTNCGAVLPDDARFCVSCGSARPNSARFGPVRAETPGRKGWNLGMFLLGLGLALVLIVGLTLVFHGSFGGKRKLEGHGFQTPEKAVSAYAKAMINGDLDGMLSTFALESAAENLNRKAWIAFCGSYPNMDAFESGILPAESDLAIALDAEGLRAKTGRMIYMQYEKVLLDLYDYKSSVSNYVVLQDDESAREFVAELKKPNPFADAAVGEVFNAEELLSDDVRQAYEDIKDQFTEMYGVDDIKNLALELEIDGEDYLLIFVVGKYNGRWYSISFNSPVLMCTPHVGGSSGLVKKEEIY